MKSADLIKDLIQAGCELKRQGKGVTKYSTHQSQERRFQCLILKVRFLLELSSRLRKQRAFSPLHLGG